MFDRRSIVLGGGALLGLAGSGAKVLAQGTAKASSLKAVITLGGRQYVYDGATGEDMGDYVGEFVRQKCFRIMRSDLPFTVFFRPDVGNDRLEVVVELGRMWGGTPAHIMDPYTAEIFREGQRVAKIDVPYHWWWARWRWQSSPRPIVRKPSSLIASALLPPYGDVSEFNLRSDGRTETYAGPMDLAGLTFDWGTTGERPEIGPVTEAQAQYIIFGTSWQTLIAQAEACGSAPFHWRDEKTGAFIDFQHYPEASMNEHAGDPLIPNPPNPRTADNKQDRRFFRVEPAHAPSLAYVPFMLTDDPYYLEELQALGELSIGFSAWFRRLHKLPGLALPGQTRAFAWSMRSLFQLGKVSPENPPRWLLSRSYWRKCVADCLTFTHLHMDSPARVYRYFRAFPEVAQVGNWQQSMLSFILSWGVAMGYNEWKDAYEWQVGGPMAQWTGRSGWNRQWPCPYHWNPLKNWRQYNEGRSPLFRDTSMDAETCADWAEAWNQFKSEQKVDDSGWDGHSIMETIQSPAYYLYARGVLAMANRLGIKDARECSKWFDDELPRVPSFRHAWSFARWSILEA